MQTAASNRKMIRFEFKRDKELHRQKFMTKMSALKV